MGARPGLGWPTRRRGGESCEKDNSGQRRRKENSHGRSGAGGFPTSNRNDAPSFHRYLRYASAAVGRLVIGRAASEARVDCFDRNYGHALVAVSEACRNTIHVAPVSHSDTTRNFQISRASFSEAGQPHGGRIDNLSTRAPIDGEPSNIPASVVCTFVGRDLRARIKH